jgi:hypothetical protein
MVAIRNSACIFLWSILAFANRSSRAQCDDWLPLQGWAGDVVVAMTIQSDQIVAAGVAGQVFQWNGKIWQQIRGGTGQIRNLGVFNGELLAVGPYYTYTPNWFPTHGIAHLTEKGWEALGGGLANDGEAIQSLFQYEGDLVVGGRFDSIGGQPIRNIARWNGRAWLPMGDFGSPMGGFLIYNNELVTGTTTGVFHWNGSNWQRLGLPFNGGVYEFATYKSQLIAAGLFTKAGGHPAKNVARWDGAAWHAMAEGAVVSNYITSIAVYNGDLIVGVDCECFPTDVVRWDGDHWAPLGGGLNGCGLSVYALQNFERILVVGGAFGCEGDPLEGIAVWHGCSQCDADINRDRNVNINDLLAVIQAWGPCPLQHENCLGDIIPTGGNGVIDIGDLTQIFAAFGHGPGGDVTGDGQTDADDILYVVMHWGLCPPWTTPLSCSADVRVNNVVDIEDLLAVIAAWGPCP